MTRSAAQAIHNLPSRPASRSLKLLLDDGTPHGLVVAELGGWNGKVLSAPRSRLPELLRRPEAAKTGLYLLTGPDPDRSDGLMVYIGEADDIAARMRTHLRAEGKDFFERLTFIVSADTSLTKAHVRYLESRFLRMVREAGSVALANHTHPDFHRLPEGDRADMDIFVAEVCLLLPVLGLDLFRPLSIAATAMAPTAAGGAAVTFVFSTAGASARARETDDGFVVLADSTARKQASGTFQAGYLSLRSGLLSDGQLVDGPSSDVYRFAVNVAFSSPSAAASVVSARSASGPLEWKVEGTGQSYREWRAGTLEP